MSRAEPAAAPDYVLVGHLCRDLLQQGERVGGTVLYAGVTALRLGLRVGLVTSYAPDLMLPPELADAAVVCLPAPDSTTFRHRYGPDGRILTLMARASDLRAGNVPAAWQAAPLIHLAPVAWEVDLDLAVSGTAGMLVATPQGWLRRADARGEIGPALDRLASLPFAAWSAAVVSVDDVGGDEHAIASIAARCQVLAVTRGAAGCTLYSRGEAAQISAWPAREQDSTGAGDVFATAFFIRLRETGDPVVSARFAAWFAARSVEASGVAGIPTRSEAERALAERAWS